MEWREEWNGEKHEGGEGEGMSSICFGAAHALSTRRIGNAFPPPMVVRKNQLSRRCALRGRGMHPNVHTAFCFSGKGAGKAFSLKILKLDFTMVPVGELADLSCTPSMGDSG